MNQGTAQMVVGFGVVRIGRDPRLGELCTFFRVTPDRRVIGGVALVEHLAPVQRVDLIDPAGRIFGMVRPKTPPIPLRRCRLDTPTASPILPRERKT